MRRDLDRLMRERDIAGMVVFAHDRYSPAMYYATGQKIHYGIYFRGADGRAHLIHDPMERDQAAAVGCEHSGFPQHGLNRLIDAEGHLRARSGGSSARPSPRSTSADASPSSARTGSATATR